MVTSRHFVVCATGTLLLILFSATAHAQEAPINVSPSENDRYAASQAQNLKHHARPANTPTARDAGRTETSNMHSAAENPDHHEGPEHGARYPADLEYHGGPVATFMRQHLIYVNLGTTCNSVATCWGDPHKFLRHLGESDMIHIVDQYTGEEANNRYTVSNTSYLVPFPPAPKYSDNDMLTIVHAVVTTFNLPTGYGNEYHVFLVPGQDECFNNPDGSISNVCYSPDIPATFFFCAYHGSADFNDIGHVLYSVEPFQDVNGCSSRPGTPNGQLADSTNNVLSHEVFETITDPDGTAWWNSLDNGLFGQEIGDECSFLIFIPNPNPPPPVLVYFDPSNVTLNGRKYAIQPEENNAGHDCSIEPPDD